MRVLARGARGLLVEEVQRKVGLTPDGVYGALTAQAVGLDVIDEADWKRIVGRNAPSLFERCLALTACFEGHSWSLAAGNWDGAGATWGIIGFTLKSGSLIRVLERIPRSVLDDVLSPGGSAELLALGKADLAARLAWGRDHSDPMIDPKVHKSGIRLLPYWQERFATLGRTPEAQAAQRATAEGEYWYRAQQALALADASFQASPRAAALLFDSCVQQGGLTSAGRRAMLATTTLEAKLVAVAEAQAVGAYVEDIRSRRMTIAQGAGTVHFKGYVLDAQGLPLLPT